MGLEIAASELRLRIKNYLAIPQLILPCHGYIGVPPSPVSKWSCIVEWTMNGSQKGSSSGRGLHSTPYSCNGDHMELFIDRYGTLINS